METKMQQLWLKKIILAILNGCLFWPILQLFIQVNEFPSARPLLVFFYRF
ncbi:hypothetical protein [Pisciglobus halotolerans]|uniref:Uncharacterized protein n=1 Tax=Pisciglobus halotolerans TaxID=745365 RepID=A0A1I3CBZ4_9LACT|nr:hypothetical protein [Pisciglobus halotolerans]SFH71997.1 hypothetical protein SAMN04489868_11619 [Pisciglobus halotolerans]